MKKAIATIIEGRDLSEKEASRVMGLLLSGEATQAQIGAFLAALRMKGETIEEVTGFAKVLCDKAVHIQPDLENYVDLVGTGGDCTYTFNISTTAAFVVAGAGLPVAKHGNRSISSKSGAGDVLEQLGVNIMADPERVKAAVETVGLGFMFAPNFNRAMRFVGQARKDMGVRTIFNVLGPLANPSQAKQMVVGVYSPELTPLIAETMMRMGVERGMVVGGYDNMDEITLTTQTNISEIKDGKVFSYKISPEQFGFTKTYLDELRGGDGAQNAVILRNILSGKEQGAKRNVVLLNAGATLYIADFVPTIEKGIEMAMESIDSGKAMKVLEDLIAFE